MSLHSMNWRQQLETNRKKTYWVILCFILIYLTTGFIIDILYSYNGYNKISTFIPYYVKGVLQGQIIPVTTILMAIAALASIVYTIKRANRVMLSGTDSYEINSKCQLSLKENQLINIVEEMKISSGLNYIPKIYIIKTPVLNALASGWNEKSSMVAVTSGLLETLNRNELQAVVAHEISHIKHQDTKLTTSTIILANLLTFVLDRFLYYSRIKTYTSRKSGGKNLSIFVVILILRFVVPLITSVLTAFLSRTREYMADAGAVKLTRNNQPLANALIKISNSNNSPEAKEYYQATEHESMRYESYIFDPKLAGIRKPNLICLFQTHPSLNQRLTAIGIQPKKNKPTVK